MFTYGVKVDTGVSEPQNDDRALIGSEIVEAGVLSGRIEEDYLVAGICDGVGGMAKGYRAAMISLEVMKYLNRADVTADTIKTAIEEANRKVRVEQVESGLLNGLRTTIAGIYTDKHRFLVFNAGDTRVYRLRYKYLMQLSKDHSLVQDLIDLGEITEDEAKNHPEKNVINKCIGHENQCIPRIVDMTGDFEDNDLILICSDGISDVLTDMDIKEILLKHSDDENLTECCEELYSRALEKGSLDNLSVIIIRKE